MRGDGKFSEDWHRLYDGWVGPLNKDRHLLKEIEQQLAQYESIWRDCKPLDTEDMQRSDESTLSGRLRLATYNLDFLVRILLWRSINLLRAFIGSLNRNDFESAPFLLRAVVEQAAFGMLAAKRLRQALQQFRSNYPKGERIFFETQHRFLFGAKVNYGALAREVQKSIITDERFDYDFSEFSIVRKMIERGEFGEKASSPDEVRFRAHSVTEMVESLSSENPIENAPPNAIRNVWEYLSQYCHPSAFAWGFYDAEAVRGGEGSSSEDQAARLFRQRCMALERFVQPAVFIDNLPGSALKELGALEAEVAREAEAIGSVP